MHEGVDFLAIDGYRLVTHLDACFRSRHAGKNFSYEENLFRTNPVRQLTLRNFFSKGIRDSKQKNAQKQAKERPSHTDDAFPKFGRFHFATPSSNITALGMSRRVDDITAKRKKPNRKPYSSSFLFEDSGTETQD
jgi:hypothetical protein